MTLCPFILRHKQGVCCNKINCKFKAHTNDNHKPTLHTTPYNLHNLFQAMKPQVPVEELAQEIDYLYTRDHLIQYFNHYGFTLTSKQMASKKALVQRLLQEHAKLATIHSLYVATFIKFQKIWRKNKEKSPSINDVDPFTLESISEIPSHLLFSYKNPKGLTYTFRAAELHHHVLTNGSYNPLNREPISSDVTTRLGAYIDALPLKQNFENQWLTATEAYLDVLHQYELFGIYTKLEWFLDLSFEQHIHLFMLTEVLMKDNQLMLFDLSCLEDSLRTTDLETIRLALAKEMRLLIQLTHPKQFFLVCSYFLILAMVEKKIARALPQWILNAASGLIHTPSSLS